MFYVTNENGILRDSDNLGIAVAEMWARTKSSSSSLANALQSVSESSDDVAISDGPNFFPVFDQEVSTIQLDVVSEADAISLP